MPRGPQGVLPAHVAESTIRLHNGMVQGREKPDSTPSALKSAKHTTEDARDGANGTLASALTLSVYEAAVYPLQTTSIMSYRCRKRERISYYGVIKHFISTF